MGRECPECGADMKQDGAEWWDCPGCGRHWNEGYLQGLMHQASRIAELEAMNERANRDFYVAEEARYDAVKALQQAEAERDEWKASFNEKCAQCGRLQSRIGDYIEEKLDLEKQVRQARAELSELKCCGNCAYGNEVWGSCDDDVDEELPDSGAVVPFDPCHFSPSRWVERSAP